MRHQLANGVYLVVQPGVCFDGFGLEDTTEVSVTDKGNILITLHSTCCFCHKPITESWCFGNYIPAQPQWASCPAYCRSCGISQIKKIRYYVEEDDHGISEAH